MKKIFFLSAIVILFFSMQRADAQELKKLTFDEVIKLSEDQSPLALIAKHRFRASYWQYRTFVAQYLPSLTLTGTTPQYSTAWERVWNSTTNTWDYISSNTLTDIGSLSLAQNIGLTGGSIFLNSSLTLFNDFKAGALVPRNYITAPLSIGITQPIFRYNSLRWLKKTEPLKYETAKKTFLSNVESVHLQAVQYFFGLALAQINKQIADMNYSNADTLFRIAQGRYQLGTIAENELLELQLQWLNTKTNVQAAEMNLRDREIRLRSFLGFNENIRLELEIPSRIPDLQVSAQEVLDLAMANNPDVMNQQLTVLNAQANVAQAKAEKGLNANLNLSYGLRNQNPAFNLAYEKPAKQQTVNLGFTLPIVDWGLGRGKYKVARSSLELAQVQSQQAIVDFQANLLLDVEQFNLQAAQVAVAAKSDTVARKMFEVTKQRFLIGKIQVLELNNADTKKDQNRRAWVQSLQDYWNYFFTVRSLALYDFLARKPLESDYEKLVK